MKFIQRFQPLLFAACLFGIVFGIKLWVIEDYGSDMPNWDQWDAEAADLLLPYQKGELKFSDLFHPQNEHRIFFTKATDLLLFKIGGQWDARAQCIVSALLHSLFAAGAYFLLRKWLSSKWHVPLFISCMILFGLPTAWHNVINGFQSQFYFLFLFSLCCIGLVLTKPRGSWGWWLGLVVGLLANFTMGSGLLAAAAVMGVLLLRVLLRHSTWTETWPALVGCALAVALGFATRVDVPWHHELHARSLGEFSLTVVRLLQWPTVGSSWAALLIYAPWLLLAIRFVTKHRPEETQGENVLLALGLWVILQCLATGYARGAGANWPVSRYCDNLAFGVIINAVILAYLLDRVKPDRRWLRFAGWALLVGWLGIVGPNYAKHLVTVLGNDLPHERDFLKACENNVSLYLATGENHFIESDSRPHPSADTLKERLSHPEIRRILPVSVRPAVPISVSSEADGAFVEKRIDIMPPSFRRDLQRWSSRSEDGASGQGEWQSAPFTPAFNGYLRIELSGEPLTAGTTLRVFDPATGKFLADVKPTRQPGKVWRAAFVPVPNHPIQLIASDVHATNSLAFSQPVEMSSFSFFALRFVKQGWLILIFSFSAAVLLQACLFVQTIYENALVTKESAASVAKSFVQKLRYFFPFPLPQKLAAEHAFGIWWLAAGLGLALLKLWLVAGQTVLAIGAAGHDDQLFINLAYRILWGQWLGPYSQFTLMKGPMYSIFIAGTHWLGIPLFTAQHILYIAACALLVRALRPLVASKALRFALFAVLLFNPVTYDSLVHGRILRQNILPGLVLIIIAGFIALYSRARDIKFRLSIWGLMTGTALGMFWLTREEGVWLVPFVTLLWIAAAIKTWRENPQERIQRLSVLALPGGVWGTMVFAVASANLLYYGVFTTCEFKHKDFKDAFGALMRVEPAQRLPYISVTRETRERLYKLSPTFAELEPYLDGSLGEAWARPSEPFTHIPPQEREIAMGWFMWALRDAVAAAGHCKTGADAMDFYRKMASEINSAVHRGKLKGGSRRSGFLPPLRREHIAPFFKTAWREINFFMSMEDMHTSQMHSMGPPEFVKMFREMTGSRIAPLPEEAPLPQTQLRTDRVRLAVLDKICRAYQIFLPWISLAAVVTAITAACIAISRRRWSFFFLIAMGCAGSVTALVLIDSLIEVTSFPALNTGYFTGGYGLWLLFLFAAGLSLKAAFTQSSPSQITASESKSTDQP